MSYDTPLNKETPWARELPAVPNAQKALAPMILEAATPLAGEQKRKRGHPVWVKGEHVALAVLWCILHQHFVQRAVWRLICTSTLGPFAPVEVSDQAVYEHLDKKAGTLLHALFEQFSRWLAEWLRPYQQDTLAPFANAVYALDESVLDPVKRWLKPLREMKKGDPALLAGRVSALFDVRRQNWVKLEVLKEAEANCKVHARAMLQGLPAGCLLLFDLGYYAFEWFDELTQQGYWWISRVRGRSSFTLIHVFVETKEYREKLVFMGAYRTDAAALAVRLVEFGYRGKWYRYVTNVRDPHVLSGKDIARLYARRWDIEMAFRVLKEYLGLQMLWSAKSQVIAVQVWACAILAQFFHALQVRFAVEAGVDTFEISFEVLIEQVVDEVRKNALPSVPVLLSRLVKQGRQIELIRPSSRFTVIVPEVPLARFVWPPEDLVYERPPRYGHRPAGNRDRQPSQTNAA